MTSKQTNLWDLSARWYDALVGEDGSYFHREVILPRTLELLAPKTGARVLDLACGQGVFARFAAERGYSAVGVDSSAELIRMARTRSDKRTRFLEADACDAKALAGQQFDSIACILALQNIPEIEPVFQNVSRWLAPGGRFVFVLMHPCFRIPRQTHWGFDEEKLLEYRRIDRYLTPLDVPILGQRRGEQQLYTMSHHRPLQSYFLAMGSAGLAADRLEEWVSNKSSQGKNARAHNRSRREFPLFLAVRSIAQISVSRRDAHVRPGSA